MMIHQFKNVLTNDQRRDKSKSILLQISFTLIWNLYIRRKCKILVWEYVFNQIQVICISIQNDIIRFMPFSGSSHCIVLFSSSFNNLVTLCSFNSLHSLLWFCNKHRSCQWWKQFSAFINISYFPISITDCKGRRQSITETALNLYHCFVFSDLMSHFTFQLSLMSPLKVWLSRLVA